jgi:hypothetical protein
MIDEEEYFRMIEQHFTQKRGNPMLLSPKEWALIREWHESGIPEEVVIRAIDRGFEKKNSDEEKNPVSLSYFKRIVKSEYKRFLKAQEGLQTAPSRADNPQSAATITEYLQRLQTDLAESEKQASEKGNSALATLLQRCRETLSTQILQPLLQNPTPELQRVEQQLTALEKEIEQGLLQTISTTRLDQFREDAMRELKSFQDKIELPVYQEMITRALIKSVRKLYNIPRLSLFYM